MTFDNVLKKIFFNCQFPLMISTSAKANFLRQCHVSCNKLTISFNDFFYITGSLENILMYPWAASVDNAFLCFVPSTSCPSCHFLVCFVIMKLWMEGSSKCQERRKCLCFVLPASFSSLSFRHARYCCCCCPLVSGENE